MAVIEIENPSSLKIKLSLGMVDGKVKTKLKSYSHLKPDASPESAYEVAKALMSLQEHTVAEVIKVDNTILGA